MAEFLVPLGQWEAENTNVTQILEGLQRLRSKARASSRVSIVTLVVLVHDETEAELAKETLAEMGARHPARTIIAVVEPEASNQPARIDAQCSLFGSYVAGHSVCTDVIQLRLAGAVVDHLDSIINPLRILDVPCAVWYLDADPMGNDSLLQIADAIIVDTKELGARFALADIADLTERKQVIDLAWLRLRPWRDLLANLFEGNVLRPFVNGVTKVHVQGKSAPRRLLSGWIKSRMNLPFEKIEIEDAQHVTIELQAESGTSQANFLVERVHDQRLVHSCVEIDGQVFFEENVGLSDRALSDSLIDALTMMAGSRVFEESLRSGLEIEDAA